MTVIKFPNFNKKPSEANASESVQSQQISAAMPEMSPIGLRVIWVLVVVSWPILSKLLALDCLAQFLIAMYRWDTAPFRGCLTFGAHFAALTALTYFVALYKPKGL